MRIQPVSREIRELVAHSLHPHLLGTIAAVTFYARSCPYQPNIFPSLPSVSHFSVLPSDEQFLVNKYFIRGALLITAKK
jgi:hypothetical protein